MAAITKKEFESLYDENITKKDYDEIIAKIHSRVSEICNKFFKRKPGSWYDFDNGSYDGDHQGYFDPNLYEEEIDLIGEYIDPPPGYDFFLPTHWLWEENWEEEMNNDIKEFKAAEQLRKEKAKAAAEKRKEKVKSLKESIKNKLTKEEYKLIKFK